MKQLPALLTLVVSSLLTVSCGNTSVAGATSETTNGIATVVVSSTGYAVKGAHVYISPAEELRAPESQDRLPLATTGKDGSFNIAQTAQNDFIVEVKDSAGNRAMGRFVYDQTEKKHVLLGQANLQLQPAGKIYGDIFKRAGQKVSVQIFGLHREVTYSSEDTVAHFSIDSLPAGMLKVKISSDDEIIAIDSVTVTPNGLKNVGVFRTKDFPTTQTDSAIVRQILDLNGKTTVSVSSVAPNMKEGKITELILDNLNLDTIPVSIGKLRLTELSLGSNNIAHLPAELFDISPLTYLDLSGNPLVAIPDNIVKLQSLVTLDIENIGLTSLPLSIIKTDIEYLFINGNKLNAKALPWEIREWINKYAMDKGWSEKQTYE